MNKNSSMHLGMVLVLFDLMLFVCFWSLGRGYVVLVSERHSETLIVVGQVWELIHFPVNSIFGPMLFPNFEVTGISIAFISYVAMCFLQMFLIGLVLDSLPKIFNTRPPGS